jgi:pyridoxamine 5'-phosphate oxidase
MDISALRREYIKDVLDLEHLDTDPIQQFELWFNQAKATEMPDPNGMSLATVGPEGQPSLRTVLLKYFDRSGFVFFTNYESRKSREIGENPRVSLMFPWIVLERQVIIYGKAEKVSKMESLKYFASRPKGSQIGAWVSHQSSVITSRSLLLNKFEEMKQKFTRGEVPLPSFWGGYRVVPHAMEFWQGRENRLHDRFMYTIQEDKTWKIERLAP